MLTAASGHRASAGRAAWDGLVTKLAQATLPEWARSAGPGLDFVVVEAVAGPGGIGAQGQ